MRALNVNKWEPKCPHQNKSVVHIFFFGTNEIESKFHLFMYIFNQNEKKNNNRIFTTRLHIQHRNWCSTGNGQINKNIVKLQNLCANQIGQL